MNGASMTNLNPEVTTPAAADLVACVELLIGSWNTHRAVIESYHGCWRYDEPGEAFDRVYTRGEGTGIRAHDTMDACDELLDVTAETGTDVGISSMATQEQDEAIAEWFRRLR